MAKAAHKWTMCTCGACGRRLARHKVRPFGHSAQGERIDR